MKTAGLVALSLSAIFAAAGTQGLAQSPNDGNLSLYNVHTSESATIDPGTAAGQRAANRLLRDHRRNEETNIDPGLFDLLTGIEAELERRHPNLNVVFHVISGYRSPQTNDMLRRTRGGQAKNSQHMHGNAMDIRVPGVSAQELRNIAWCQQRGGVGYYGGYIHIDTYSRRTTTDPRFPNGRMRAWGWSPTPGMCNTPGNS